MANPWESSPDRNIEKGGNAEKGTKVVTCYVCNGTGKKNGKTCPDCNGKGKVEINVR